MTTALAVFAHPDDESLLAGGALAAAAEAGMDVVIVSASRGEAGIGPGGNIGALREQELKAAAGYLGARTSVCLGFPDGSLRDVVPEMSDRITQLCQELRPDFIVTFASDGWYWHPDHVAVWAAVSSFAQLQQPGVAVYATTWPRHRMTRLVRAARKRAAPAELWGLPTAAFGSAPREIEFVLDVSSFLAAKVAAIGAHRSQLPDGSLFGALPSDLVRRYLGHEFLRAEYSEAGAAQRFPERLRAAGVGVRERRRRPG